MDAGVQEFIAERFVPVWIDDRKEEKFASTTLKLTDKGYPNIALFDADGAYYGRVVGFGGLDPWFQDLKESVDRWAEIGDLRAKAADDAKANADLAPLLAEVPDLEQEALDAFAAVPEEARTPAVVGAELKLRGKLAWSRTRNAINDEFSSLLEGVDRKNREAMEKALKDAYGKMAPRVREKVDAFIKEFPTAEEAADALLAKANALVQSDALQEGIDTFKTFIEKFPEHPSVVRARQMIDAAMKKLDSLGEGSGSGEEEKGDG